MAIYVYRCNNCCAEEEIQHPMSEVDDPTEETIQNTTCYCTKSGEQMKRVPQNFIFGTDPGERREKARVERKKRNEKHYVKHELGETHGANRIHQMRKRGYDVTTQAGKLKAYKK
jgi:hypothetical protein